MYVGADDGRVYCLSAGDGKLLWRFDAALGPDRVIGQGRVMSLWPVRTGVLVDRGTAYFAAGLYPNMGLKLYAVNAEDGKPLWTESNFGREDASAQGYLMADERRIVVPSGRTFPLVFDRETGKFQWQISFGRSPPNGGSFAILAGEQLINGTNCMTGYDMNAVVKDRYGRDVHGPVAWSWLRARAAVARGELLYMATDAEIFAVGRAEAGKACGTRTGFETDAPDWSKCAFRQSKAGGADELMLAGGRLIAGSEGRVIVYEAASGKELWSADVEGNARGLAVAGARLVVSTTSGRVYCFGAGERGQVIAGAGMLFPPVGALAAQAAEEILAQAGVHSGFGLVIAAPAGSAGRLACELARRSELTIYLLERDEPRAEDARAALEKAGVGGDRVVVESGTMATANWPRYFANLVVDERALLEGKSDVTAAELGRIVKPCGGVAVVAGDGEAGQKWVCLRRGKLTGAADWTHQGANGGNTYCSGDEVVRPPFGVLWFGQPGARDVMDRHAAGSAPLLANGRMILAGKDALLVYDAYNGIPLWRREMKGIGREHMPMNSANIVAGDEHVFLVAGEKCLRLNAATGARDGL